MEMKLNIKKLLRSRSVQAGILIVILVGGWGIHRMTAKAQAQIFTANVRRGNLTSIVQATGTVTALTTVLVGSQISGRIVKLYVDFNSHVKKGQLLAEIDPTIYENTVRQDEANLANTRANVQALSATIQVDQQAAVSKKAGVAQAKAGLSQARLDYERELPLYKQGIISAQQRDQVVATYQGDLAAVQAAQAGYDQAIAQIKSAQAQLLQAQAQVKQQQAVLRIARTNLGYCRIYSPIDGVVVNRAVEIGQTVAASFQTPTLFTIAQDLSKMYVDVQTDESDVGRLKVGDPAQFTVDAFPNQVFHGRIAQVRMNATTVQNVVEYDTIVDFNNPGNRVFPGMTAYIRIPVAEAHDRLLVPNTALSFHPPLPGAQVHALLAQYGISQSGGKSRRGGAGAAVHGFGGRGGHADPRPGGNARPQGPRPGEQPAVTSTASSTAVIWKLGPKKSLIPVMIRTGITDFTDTAVERVIKGSLAPGDKIIIGELLPSSSSSPFGGRRRF